MDGEKAFFMMPEIASAHGAQIDHAVRLVHALILLLFLGWSVYLVYLLVRFRRRAQPVADHHGINRPLWRYTEVAVLVAEAFLLIGISIPLWAERVDAVPPESEAIVVRIVAEQYAWNMHYPGADGKFGTTSIDKIALPSNPLGLVREGDGADDITTINRLHLPVGQPAILQLASKDVIHGFSLPHFRIKQDVIPGLRVPVWFTPTVTTEQMRVRTGNGSFEYEIACAQLCGLGHAAMRGFVTVHTAEGFDAWLAEQARELAAAGTDEFWN